MNLVKTKIKIRPTGKNSLFSSYVIGFNNTNKKKIHLKVIKTDKRFFYSKSKLISSGIEATIYSFFRSENIEQKKIVEFIDK